MSIHEASAMIGVSPATLRRWSDAGDIKAFTTPGGHRRFSRAAVIAMLPAERQGRPHLGQLGETPQRMTRIYRRELLRAAQWAPWIDTIGDADRQPLRDHGDRIAGALLAFFDAVILATSGPAAAGLLADVTPAAAEQIRTIPHGSTAVVTLAYPLDRFAEAPAGHGFLVAAGEPLAIDACTFSSRKWAGRAPDGTILLRCFVGSRRPEVLAGSDEAVLAAVERDVATTLGVRGEPIFRTITRATNLMPHYTVGHLERVGAAFEALADLPGLVLAGAPYRGVGLPDCIAQGRAAAAAVESLIGNIRSTSTRPMTTLGVDRDQAIARLPRVALVHGPPV